MSFLSSVSFRDCGEVLSQIYLLIAVVINCVPAAENRNLRNKYSLNGSRSDGDLPEQVMLPLFVKAGDNLS